MDISFLGFLVGLLGMWMFSDAIWSILYYPEESWLRNHSIRLVRAGAAVVLIAISFLGG